MDEYVSVGVNDHGEVVISTGGPDGGVLAMRTDVAAHVALSILNWVRWIDELKIDGGEHD